MINVLMIGSHFSAKGGISTVIEQIDGWLKNSDELNYQFISTYVDKNLFSKSLHFCDAIFRIKKMISSQKIDLVHIHMSYKGSYVRKRILCNIFWKQRIPTILHIHGSEFKVWYDGLTNRKKEEVKEFLLKQKKVIVLGEEWANFFRGIDSDINISVIHNAVSIPEETVSWENESKKIFFSGVLLKRKGIYDLIDAMVLLKKSNYLKTNCITLKIAGTGEEAISLKEKVEELGLEKYVSFLGWIGDKKELKKEILDSTIGVLPSYNEGLPMSLLECMSYGLPMISTNVGSIASVISDGKNGVLITPGNAEELALAIEKLLNDQKKWQLYSDNAKDTIVRNFDEQKLFTQLALVYQEVSNANV
ncbi:hypothetical protein UAY_02609 [Enterococcus moraviensis ATCC BAA-383]|uniref:Glycosyl transferase family 1 domain-containing protein n=1 Tax=Enterococcus moraviensis ATCC BAA-383 TaxID=1158609 RepID=R2QJV1_9ENTE|nr:glycosyltransferase family 4 protein [Enterococcus moraviensis]EOH96877.1 hypothetical protein UAY_02609 [Enterococcus moraviensis ATCC BAA-383]EOT71508.1 hypothetical protein I586_01309 [Enterococcus moraviensis ATCC BAA-383]